MNTTLSILMPVFNGEGTVIQAIQSIKNQTWQDWELIIVDDGSSDKSYSRCEEIAKSDHRIKLFRNAQNKGLAKTMNRLFSLAIGEYIAIQEQDDQSTPERLEKEVALLQSMPDVGIVSGIAAWVDREGRLIGHFPGLLVRGEQYPQDRGSMVKYLYTDQCKVVNAACMIRRSIMDQIPGPFDPEAKMSIDWQFFIRAAHITKIWGIPEVLVNMLRDQTHSNFTKRKDIQFPEARRCIQRIYEDFADDPASPVCKTLYRQAMVTEMLLESRHYLNIKGFSLFLKSFFMNPLNPKVRQQIGWYWNKTLHKFKSNFSWL